MGAGIRRPASDQPCHRHVQYVDAGKGRPHGTAAGVWTGPIIPGRTYPHHRLARPGPGEPLRGLYRLHRPQIRRGVHPGGPGLPAKDRPRTPPGHVPTGNLPALHRAFHLGLQRQRT